MPVDQDFAFSAVDEAQLGTDPERGHVFTDRMLRARGREETLILGSDILYAEPLHPQLRRIFDANLAHGGSLLLSDPFRETSMRLLEAMEAAGWQVTMDKWTVGVTPPPRPVGVFSLSRR